MYDADGATGGYVGNPGVPNGGAFIAGERLGTELAGGLPIPAGGDQDGTADDEPSGGYVVALLPDRGGRLPPAGGGYEGPSDDVGLDIDGGGDQGDAGVVGRVVFVGAGRIPYGAVELGANDDPVGAAGGVPTADMPLYGFTVGLGALGGRLPMPAVPVA